MNKGVLIAIGLMGLAFAACKKDDNGKAATTAELLTSSTWKYDTVMLDVDKDGTPDSNVPAGLIGSCTFDNTITFNSDMTGITDEGPMKCADSLAQTTTFSWSLKNNDSTLSIVGNSAAELNGDIAIKEITNTQMVLVKHIVIRNVITIDANAIVTLKK